MRSTTFIRQSTATLLFTTALIASSAQALLIDISVALGSLSGTPGVLAFDFQASALTGNTVLLTALSPVADSSSGNNANSPPDNGPWLFHDTGFEELLLTYGALPSVVSFRFQTSDSAPPGGVQPDVFSLSLLDANLLPLITTQNPADPNDLTCASALIYFNLGDVSGQPTVCSADQGVVVRSVTVGPNPTSIPEPLTPLLILAGLAAAMTRPGKVRVRAGQYAINQG